MANSIKSSEVVKYEKYYSRSKLFDKIGKVAKRAGLKAIYGVLLLYYVLIDGNLSVKDRGLIIGALGYFVFPLDFLPDWIIPVGYTDDLAILLYVIGKIRKSITPEIKMDARKKLQKYFKIEDKDFLNEIC